MAKIAYFSLGGQDEKGRYSGVLEVNNEFFILNAGIGAEFSNQLGIKKVIPDFRYLIDNKAKVKAIFIGCHRNLNIASLPYFLEAFPDVPVYTSPFGKLVIESFLFKYQADTGKKFAVNINAINPSNDVAVGSLKVCGVKTASSVPNSYGWMFKLVTGQTVVFLDEFLVANENKPCCESQLHILTQQSKNKTSLLLIGAQNVGKMLGFSYPHAQNFSFLKRAVASTKNRILVSAYEDDWNTLLNLSKIAKIYGMNFFISCPRIALVFNNYVDTLKKDSIYAKSTQLLNSDNSLIAIIGDNETLYRKLKNIHAGEDEIQFKDGDLLIIATLTLPENEYEEITLLNDISKRDVILLKQPKTIMPYCAGSEDIKLIVNALSPYNIVPVDGYYKDFVSVQQALSNTIEPRRIRFLGAGERLEIDDRNINITTLPITKQYVNDEGILDINQNIVLERQLMEKNGLIVISVIYNSKNHHFSQPVIITKALITSDYSKKDEILASILKHTQSELAKYLSLNKTLDIKGAKLYIKEAVYKGIRSKMLKKPLVLPLITKH